VGDSNCRQRGFLIVAGQEDWVPSFIGTVGAGVSVRLPWLLWLQLDALVGVALPRPAVGLGGRSAASWGQPFVATNLGLGVRL
jgi:hypothetical protein